MYQLPGTGGMLLQSSFFGELVIEEHMRERLGMENLEAVYVEEMYDEEHMRELLGMENLEAVYVEQGHSLAHDISKLSW
ncbi:hypothetical protein J6590_066202 [Homalodisca vitripennis]|nr:hypothetical protein J6590_066202 [Homalodisca vitripennis]